MSSSFNNDFCVPLGSLDRTLEVIIADDRMVSASDVYRDYMLEIFGIGFLIDLLPILITDVCMITSMN